jgi:hypothetical protein
MKALGRSLRIRLTSIVFLLPIFLAITTVQAETTKTKYIYLTSKGNYMAPTICDGDTVKVEICTNGALIHAGPKNSTHPGDIIVYCAGAAVPEPKYMWMCGRAIKKYWKNGEWYFKTQLDNNPEPDAWEVPEHFLLGVVVEVIRRTDSQNKPILNQYIEDFNALTVVDFFTGVMIGVVIGLWCKTYIMREKTS